MKKISKSKLIKQLDDVFQTYIRYRDGWTCITCNVRIENDKFRMHAGHYIGRGNYNTRWDEENVNAQCQSCNGKEHWTGDKNTYALALKKKYGDDILERLENKKHEIFQGDINELIEIYQKKLDNLQKIVL